MKNFNAVGPLFAFDVDTLLIGKPPKRQWPKLFQKNPQPVVDMEFSLFHFKNLGSVVLLCPYEQWQIEILESIIERACYNYMIQCRSKMEFEMFRDRFTPYFVVSNIPKRLWGGEYSDVYEYTEGVWQSAVDIAHTL